MFVTRIRAGVFMVLCLALAALATGCGPPGPRAVLKGRQRLEAGQTAAAITEFKFAASLLPTNAAVWNYLGLAYHRAGEVTNAFEAYSRAIKLDRDLLEARFNLGCLWLDANRPEAAKTEFIAYTLRRANHPEGWLKLGSAQWREHDAAGAEKSFREALRLQTNNVEALNGLGLVRLRQKQPRAAAELFEEALRHQPDYRPALLNLALVSQQQLDDRPEALRRFREYLALQPRAADWDAVNALAQSLEPRTVATAPARPQTNHVSAAKVESAHTPTNPVKPLASEVVTKPGPTAAPTLNSSAAKPTPVAAAPPATSTQNPPPSETSRPATETVARPVTHETKPAVANSHTAAPTVVEAATAPPPAKPARSGFFAKLNPFRNDEQPSASHRSSPANAAANTHSTAPLSSADATAQSGRAPSDAPSAGDRASAEVAFGQGQQSLRANRLAEALQSFRRATQLDPGYYEAYYNLGLTAFKLRSFVVALAAWEKAVALRPKDADARYNLALTMKASGEAQAAADELERLLALHPDEARAHLTLGNLYAEPLRDIPRARRHYQQVLQLDPRNPQAQAIRYWLVAHPG